MEAFPTMTVAPDFLGVDAPPASVAEAVMAEVQPAASGSGRPLSKWAQFIKDNAGSIKAKYGADIAKYNTEKKAAGQAQTGFFHYAKIYGQEQGFAFQSEAERKAKREAQKSSFLSKMKNLTPEEKKAMRARKSVKAKAKKGEGRKKSGGGGKKKVADETNCELLRRAKADVKAVADKAKRELLLALRRNVPTLITMRKGEPVLKSLKCGQGSSKKRPAAKKATPKKKATPRADLIKAAAAVAAQVYKKERKEAGGWMGPSPTVSKLVTTLTKKRKAAPKVSRSLKGLLARKQKKTVAMSKKDVSAMKKLLVQLKGGLGN